MPEVAEQHPKKSLYKKITEAQGHNEEERKCFEDLWDDVIDLLRPELTQISETSEAAKGEKRGLNIYTGAPEDSLQTWVDGSQGYIVSASIDWFTYSMADKDLAEDDEIRKWLQKCEKIIYALFSSSNFYPSLSPCFRDAGSIGNTSIFMDKVKGEQAIAYSNFHPREPYFREDALGRIDAWHRKFEFTARQAAEKFDIKKLSISLQNSLQDTPLDRYEFIHAIYPRHDPIFKNIDEEEDVPDRPWIEVYIQLNTDEEKKKPLRCLDWEIKGDIAGYWSKPFAAWRYMKVSDSVYGWGIGCSAIVDVFGINEMARLDLIAANQAVDPATIGSRTLRGKVNVMPGGRTWTDKPWADEYVKRILERIDYPIGKDQEEAKQESIDKRFNVDFFLMMARTDKQMTIPELMERVGERAIILGPRLIRLEDDFLDPIHDRTFDIALQAGWLPDPPQRLLDATDGTIKVEYIGPLAQAQQRLFRGRRMERALTNLAPLLALKEDAIDYLKVDESVVRVLKDENWPQDEIRSYDEVKEIRRIRAEREAAIEAAEMAKEAAEVSPKLAKAPEEGSPLSKLTAGM